MRNIGKIENVEIVVDGITVIAGENNTGKSTVGKALYAAFHSGFRIDEQVRGARIDGVLRSAYMPNVALRAAMRGREVEFAEKLVDSFEKGKIYSSKDVYALLMQYVQDERQIPSIQKYVEDTFRDLQIDDTTLTKKIVEGVFAFEFDGQVNNLFSADKRGEVILTIRNEKYGIVFLNNSVSEINNLQKLYTEAFYIDDPFVLHNRRQGLLDVGLGGYRRVLRGYLQPTGREDIVRSIRVTEVLQDIYSKLGAVCPGNIIVERGRLVYQDDESRINVDNLSAGLKSFAILKTLLQNGSLEYNGTIILDEPEIHLHPAWQIKFAEVIILLRKAFHLHILLNTHSPYFLDAIERYSEKYGVAEECRYYMSEADGVYADFRDVTGHIDLIYKKLVQPLDDMDGINNAAD